MSLCRGVHCEDVVTTCPDSTKCNNGGTCQALDNVVSTYICLCPSGVALDPLD